MTAGRHRTLLFVLGIAAVVGVAAAAVFAVGWQQSVDERDDALADRDAAVAASDAAQDAADQAGDALVTTRAALEASEAETARLEAELDASQATAASLSAANDELTTEIDELEAANSVLVQRVEELEQELDSTDVQVQSAFVSAEHPEFTRYVGEVLSSRSGGSRLTADQSRCFGGAVIDLIGLDGFGAGLHNASSSATNNELVASMQAAATECGIDQTLIFG